MAEQYSFFDAVLDSDGVTYDREYNAQQFTDYFETLVTTGVVKGVDESLKVSTNNASMITSLNTGVAYIEGRYYKNDSPLSLTHDTETIGRDRIDRIVIRMDLSPETRYVKSFIKKGAPSTNPVAPTLTQTSNLYEISLAQVKIIGGQTFIATNAVTDERGKAVVCPWAGSNILPSFDDNALAQHVSNQEIHVTQTKQNNWNQAYDATKIGGRLGVNCQQGFTNWNDIKSNGWFMGDSRLNAPNNSAAWFMGEVIVHNELYVLQRLTQFTDPAHPTYERLCNGGTWTAWAKVPDKAEIDQLFTLYGDKNRKIASAISDKGVPTSADATGDQMASNIRGIQTGRKEASGTKTNGNTSYIDITNSFDFVPKMVLIKKVGGFNKNTDFALYVDPRVLSANETQGISAYLQYVGTPTDIHNTGIIEMRYGGFRAEIGVGSYGNNYYWMAFS